MKKPDAELTKECIAEIHRTIDGWVTERNIPLVIVMSSLMGVIADLASALRKGAEPGGK